MFQDIAVTQLVFLAVGLLAAGAVTGLLAGIFGVGGGAIIVPVLYELFRIQGVPEDVRMPLAVGTSLAIIIPTSIRSFRAHQRKGLALWQSLVLSGQLKGVGLRHPSGQVAVHIPVIELLGCHYVLQEIEDGPPHIIG